MALGGTSDLPGVRDARRAGRSSGARAGPRMACACGARRARRGVRDHRRPRAQAGARRRRQGHQPAGRAAHDRPPAVRRSAADRSWRSASRGYAAWRLLRAAVGHGAEQTRQRPRPRRRAGQRHRLRHPLRDGRQDPQRRRRDRLRHAEEGDRWRPGWSGGPVLVAIAGVVLLGVAGLPGLQGRSAKKFLEDSKTEQMGPAVERAFTALGVVGPRARTVVFALVGYGLIKAAIDYDPQQGGRPGRRAAQARARVLRAGAARRRRGRARRLRRLLDRRRALPAGLNGRATSRVGACPASSSDRSCGTSTTRVATVWVQTDVACEVEILGARERTWCVGGLHFALVTSSMGWQPGADHPYEVRLDGEVVWPRRRRRPSRRARSGCSIAGARRDIVFGSCRHHAAPRAALRRCARSEHPDGPGHRRAARLRAARRRAPAAGAACPDMLLMLGDQIYADQPSPALQEAIAARERPADAPDGELADFAEYALAYGEAWREPAIRWLLSTVPVTMVFDDHEIHAEWRISQGWLDEMNAKPWFDGHIRAGLMAYWVFQHIGNLSPDDAARGRASTTRCGACRRRGGAAGVAMDTEGRQVGHSRWSFARDVGDARLVVIDSRAGRERDARPPRARSGRGVALDPRAGVAGPRATCCWPARCRSCSRPGLHHVEALDEALTDGAWGTRRRVRSASGCAASAVMDHWASFQRTFRRLCRADRRRRARPRGRGAGVDRDALRRRAPLLPGRGRLPPGRDRRRRRAARCGRPSARRSARSSRRTSARVIAFGHSAARRAPRAPAGACRPACRALPLGWRVVERPAYANQIATLTLEGEHARVSVEAISEGDWRDASLELAFSRDLT